MTKPLLYEKRMLSFLTRHYTEKCSINQLAKRIGMTPKGAHKLLKRLESEGLIIPQRLANATFYSLNFASDLARKNAELALFDEIPLPYAQVQAKDLERLRPVACAAILFGSVLDKGERAADIDLLAVVEEHSYAAFQQALEKIQRLKPKRIQAVLQTPSELAANLKKADRVLLEILATGKVLWGHEIIVNAIREASQ